MKLLSCFKGLILEGTKYRKLVDKFNVGDKDILLFASYHQWEERYGSKSYDEILEIYETFNYKDLDYRIGVPNFWIGNIFKKNFYKIQSKFNEIEKDFKEKYPPKINIVSKKTEKSENPRIHIIKNRQKENEINGDPEEFDFIEFIVQKNDENTFDIVTSAFSNNGRYLKIFKSTKDVTPKLFLEHKFYYHRSLII